MGRINWIAGLIVLAAFGCGKEGPPLAPSRPGPVPVLDLEAQCDGDGVELCWTLPAQRLDGSRLEDLAGYRVLMSKNGSYTVVDEVRFREQGLAMMEGRRVVWRQTGAQGEAAVSYRVVTFTGAGENSLPSNIASSECPGGDSPAAQGEGSSLPSPRPSPGRERD